MSQTKKNIYEMICCNINEFAITYLKYNYVITNVGSSSRGTEMQSVDKDNRDVCCLSVIDPRPNCGLASALN